MPFLQSLLLMKLVIIHHEVEWDRDFWLLVQSAYFLQNATTFTTSSTQFGKSRILQSYQYCKSFISKQIIMLEEYQKNPSVADAIKNKNKAFFEYDVWQTDHSFTNKRVALINKVLAFIDK